MSYYNSYDPYKDVNAIYRKGLEYQEAKTDEERQKAHKTAQQYYNALTNNGYDDVAAQLRKSDSAARKQLSDQYGMQGRTGVRDYMKKYGVQYGLSESDIDKNIGWNDATKEVTLYGQNIGKPSAVVNGRSYDDISKIRANFDDVMKNLGITRSSDTLYRQNMDGATAGYDKADAATAKASELIDENRKTRNSDMQKYGQEYGKYTDELYNPSTYSSKNADAIRASYRERGDIAADGAIADSAATNSGNVDSFAAANARRQQLAYENAANEAILADYNARMDRIQNAMNNLGIQQQARWNADSGDVTQQLGAAQTYTDTAGARTNTGNTIFSNSEAQKQAEHERSVDQQNLDLLNKKTYAEVTGRNPKSWNKLYSQNPFFDENGKLINADGIDYQQRLNKVRDQIANETNAAEKEKLKEREQQILAARYQKVLGGLGYERYADTLEMPTYTEELTDPAKQWRDENAVARETLASDNYNQEQNRAAEAADNEANRQMQYRINAENNQAEQAKPTLTAEQAKKAIEDGIITEATVAAFNYHFGSNYTVDNIPKIAGGPMSDEDVKWWVDDLNKQVEEKYPGKTAINKTGANTYGKGDIDADWIIRKVLESDSLTPEQQEYLLYDKFGITDDQVNTAMKDPHYR